MIRESKRQRVNLEGGMTPSSYILRSHSLQVTGKVHLRAQSTSKTASSTPQSHTLTVKALLALAVLGGREGERKGGRGGGEIYACA